ncbi:MAG: glycosyltransferase family 1 protein [Deltaproteobacteria bacterium]|nr:glycosyltransferase family 1 protein [Deltaproteobacteria bacterium]
MVRKRTGKIVVMHLAARYPLAGVMWQLLHHLIGFRQLGFDVYYIEDNGGVWVYDPSLSNTTDDPRHNVKLLADALETYGFKDRWAFIFDYPRQHYYGMEPRQALELIADADAVINLCAAMRPRDEILRSRCLIYLETDPSDTAVRESEFVAPHKLHFTYGYNIGAPDCILPTGNINWRRTRPPVLLDQWLPGTGPAEPATFTTVGTWQNKGHDIQIAGETYYWSKHLNFRQLLEIPRRTGQPMEMATDLNSGPDYQRAIAGGFKIVPAVPMSVNLDSYRQYIASSRGEFTAAKDLYVRTRSGWFSDRSVCYLAAGRPVITQRTVFEKFIPTGAGLLGFDDADEAVEAVHAVNADYTRHAKAAREIACEYFDALKLLDEIAQSAGL